MGQAKQRGTFEHRKKQAIERERQKQEERERIRFVEWESMTQEEREDVIMRRNKRATAMDGMMGIFYGALMPRQGLFGIPISEVKRALNK